MVLLNSKQVDKPLRNSWLPNTVLTACVLMFIYLGATELVNILTK